VDAIQFACALDHAIFTVVTDDMRHDKIKEIKRISMLDLQLSISLAYSLKQG